jgi:EAL domain-containing protein (putative c-di-GMP-specific phosphodiesterase class I)
VVITARRLLNDKLFSICYQPIVALSSGGTGKEYYEVILGTSGKVSNDDIPEDFINNLFKSDIAAEVDRWVINEALISLSSKLRSNPNTQLAKTGFGSIRVARQCADFSVPRNRCSPAFKSSCGHF